MPPLAPRCPKCGGEFVDRSVQGEGVVCERGCCELAELIDPGIRLRWRAAGVEQEMEDMLRRAYKVAKDHLGEGRQRL